MRSLSRTRSALFLLVPACALVLAACSSSPSPSGSSSTTSTSAATTTSSGRSTTTTTSAAATTSTTSGTLTPQSSTVSEFYSPSKNISCEIDNGLGSGGTTGALCLTISPARSATLGTDSTVTECTGVNCLSNAGVNTPVLAYNTSITLGPFTCVSLTTGMQCTLASGAGFLISKSSTLLLGNAKLATSSS